MIKRWLRGLIREEIEAERERIVAAMVDAIQTNNRQLEQDLVRLGVLDFDERGGVRPLVD